MSDTSLPDTGELSREQSQAVADLKARFVTAMSEGSPRIEQFLSEIEPRARDALLVELIRAEIEFCTRHGKAIDPSEYRDRFPERTWLDQLFPDDHETVDDRQGEESAPERPPSGETVSFVQTSLGSGAASESATHATRAGLGGYEILEELGRGGMGVVYKARHVALDRVVAVKMILSGSHAGSNDLARFKTEAESVARLQHPGIVQIHEVGEHQGLPYFSLEFCSGGSLADKLDGTPLPAEESATLVENLARAIHAAHSKGVIHRDLKPANVLLAEDGSPKITDFGLAKKLDEAGQTHTGAVMGTPSYMPPEQARGDRELGPTVDVYALGAMLYVALTGRPPFRGATVMETIQQVLQNEVVPVRQLNPTVPLDLETICLKCLQKQPAKRYESAENLADDLGRFLQGQPILARPVGALERGYRLVKRNPVVSALTAAVLLGLVGTAIASAWAMFAYRDLAEAESRGRNQLQEALDKLNSANGHLDEAQLAITRGDWPKALAEHDAAIADRPDLAGMRLARARLYLMLGLLDEAADDVEAAFARQVSAHPTAWYYRAALKLYQGDDEGYRATCAELRQRFGRTTSKETARWVYDACTLQRESGTSLEQLRNWAALFRGQRRDDGEGGLGLQAFLDRPPSFEIPQANEIFVSSEPPPSAEGLPPEPGEGDDWMFCQFGGFGGFGGLPGFPMMPLPSGRSRKEPEEKLTVLEYLDGKLGNTIPTSPPRNVLLCSVWALRAKDQGDVESAQRLGNSARDLIGTGVDAWIRKYVLEREPRAVFDTRNALQRYASLEAVRSWAWYREAARALKLEPADYPLDLVVRRAVGMGLLNRLDRAEPLLARAMELDSTGLAVPNHRLDILRRLGREGEMLAVGRGIIRRAAAPTAAKGMLDATIVRVGRVLASAGRYSDAAEAIETAPQEEAPSSRFVASRLYWRARFRAAEGDYDEAVRCYGELLELPASELARGGMILDPPGGLGILYSKANRPTPHLLRWLVLDSATERIEVYERLLRHQKAVAAELGLSRALRIADAEPEEASRLVQNYLEWWRRASTDLRSGKLFPAKVLAASPKFFEEAIGRFPDDYSLWLARLKLLRDRRETDDVVGLACRALDRTWSPRAISQFHTFLLGSPTKFPLDEATLVQRRRPTDHQLLVARLSRLLSNRSDPSEALRELDQALEDSSQDPAVLEAVLRPLEQKGQKNKAYEVAGRLLEMRPELTGVWLTRARLAKQLGHEAELVRAVCKVLGSADLENPLASSAYGLISSPPELTERALKVLPDDPRLCGVRASQVRRTAMAHVQKGEYAEAEPEFRRAAHLSRAALSDDWHSLLVCQLRRRDLGGYRRTCSEMVSRHHQVDDVGQMTRLLQYGTLGPCESEDGERLVAVARRLVKANAHAQSWLLLGAALHRTGRHEKALSALAESNKLHGRGGLPSAWRYWSMACAALSDDGGLRWFGRYQSWHLRSKTRSSWRSKLELEWCACEVAASLTPGTTLDLALELAHSESRGEWGQVQQHLNTLLREQPWSSDLHVRRAYALQRQGKYAESLKHYFLAGNLGPRGRLWPIDGAARERGSRASSEEDWDRAVEEYRLAAHQPWGTMWEDWYPLLLCQLRAGSLDGYRETCSQLIRRFEKSPSSGAISYLLLVCSTGPCSKEQAERLVTAGKRLTAREKDATAFLRLGSAQYRAGRFREAIATLEESNRLHGKGGYAVTWTYLSMAYGRLGNAKEAKRWFGKVDSWFRGAQRGHTSVQAKLQWEWWHQEANKVVNEE